MADIAKAHVRAIIRSQYHAALEHLHQAIELCPDQLWTHAAPNHMPFWRVAYHTLYFTHLYLQHNDHEFRPRDYHQTNVQYLDGYPSPPHIEDICEHPHRPPQTGNPYSREQLLDYWRLCDALIDTQLETMDLDRTDSGFSWYRLSKLEHQFINIRHIQHHSAQLADRLRQHANIAVNWGQFNQMSAYFPPDLVHGLSRRCQGLSARAGIGRPRFTLLHWPL